MGFWNDGVRSPSPSRRKSYSSRSGPYNQPSFSRSASSLFGVGGGSDKVYSSSRSGRGYSSRPRPRSGFVARIRKFLRDLFDYVRRNPVKVFFLVVMPLITGGALTKILAHLGVRLPRSLENLASSAAAGRAGGRYYARGGARDHQGGTVLPGMGGGVGEALGAVAGIAKHFL
ncbi:hypothetical protein DV736_g107, partial [Chaetothyriales sp. CBS 134916]